MQIVIDIPKELYIACEKLCKTHHLSRVEDAIGKGTPLPKHCGRLIEDCFSDGDNNDNWHTVFNDDTGCYENVILLDDIKSAPTIIPATKEKNCEDCTNWNEHYGTITCMDCQNRSLWKSNQAATKEREENV